MKKLIILLALGAACKQSAEPTTKQTESSASPATAASPAATTAPGAVSPSSSGARDYIAIVGSSTVYPFATVVAEQFGRTTKFKAPKVEATGSGGGLKLFCEGVGVKYPDIANSSRRIKPSEVSQCKQNGVADIVELKIGYDGIVIANSKRAKVLQIGLRQLWLALAKEVPDSEGHQTRPNPNLKWSDLDRTLPEQKVEVLGPPPTSGTRDAFAELALEGGCNNFEWIKALERSDEGRHKQLCQTIREDGAFIEAGENDNLIVQKLDANPDAFGVFGFSFLDQNSEKVQAATIDGVAPTFETIANGSYPVSRPLYLYVKKAHVNVIPGIAEYLSEFTSPKAWGPEGYLTDKGMIPMPDAEREQFRAAATQLTPLQM
jgi:phosphate transport system substrate-binding protein